MRGEKKHKFEYIESEEFVKPDEKRKNVTGVIFETGRYGINTKQINMEKTTERGAIRAVEEWLSEPLSEEELKELKETGDVFDKNKKLEEYKCRGDALGDCIYLEEIVREGSVIELICGS